MMAMAFSWPTTPSSLHLRPTLLALAVNDAHDDQTDETTGTEGVAPDQLQRFESLFHDFEQAIFAYLWRVTGDEQAARDLLQETFVRAWRHFAKISAYEHPGGWLYRVATNLALNHLRDRSGPIEATISLDEGEALSSRDLGSLLAMRDLVRQTLSALSVKQRAALILREVHGLSCEEVGRALGCSRDAAKVLLYRAREAFRTQYTWLSNGGQATQPAGEDV